MSRLLSRPISRRKLIGTAAAAAAGASVLRLPGARAAGRGQAIQVLVHDEVQDGSSFGRGQLLGSALRNGVLQGPGGFESAVLESPFPFTHVGLHWRGQGPRLEGVTFEVRTSPDGSAWTGWQPLAIEARPGETPLGETFASLVGAPRHGYLQYRTNLPGGSSIGLVTATFLNSVDGPSSQTTPSSLIKPSAVDRTREDWGCDERLRFRGKKELWPRMFVPVKKLVVHHTATSNTYSDGAAEVRAIYTYHARTLGWGDIGYNLLVDRFGISYEGRYGRELASGREVCGPDVVAGHASAHNYGSWGAAAIGNFEDAGVSSNSAIVSRLVDALEYVATEREIDPQASSDFLLSNDTWNRNLANVSGHRDCNPTACPGVNLYALLGDVRSALAARLSKAAAPAFLSGPDGASQSGGSLEYSWGGSAGAEFKFYLEGWHKSSSSEDITYLTGFTSDRRPDWPSEWTTETTKSYSGLASGRYTFHVLRREDASVSYQGNRTVLFTGESSGGGGGGPPGGNGPPGRQR
jgi:hypothetical protein